MTSFFKERDCFTLVQPHVDEEKLQILDKLEDSELRAEFSHQVLNFRKRVMSNIKPKTFQNKQLNGDMYVSLLTSYVTAINNGAVPNIENAWNYMCEEQSRKAVAQSFEIFIL